MELSEIRRRPTDVREIPSGCRGVHESTLRAWAILDKVKEMLKNGYEPEFVLEVIEDLEGGVLKNDPVAMMKEDAEKIVETVIGETVTRERVTVLETPLFRSKFDGTYPTERDTAGTKEGPLPGTPV